jgi:hypothetical protein
MDQRILQDIGRDATDLVDMLRRRDLRMDDVAVIVAGAMPGIVKYETEILRYAEGAGPS